MTLRIPIPLLVFVTLAVVLVTITPSQVGYDGPVRLARELLQGRTYLPEWVEWLEMFRHDGRAYIAYPPMVSAVMVPYVWLFGPEAGQPPFNSFLILGTAFLLYRVMSTDEHLAPLAPLGALAYVMATPVLYSATSGEVWLLMHSEGNFFLLLALHLARDHRRYLLAGLSFMIAVQCRYVIALTSLGFGLLFLEQEWNRGGLPRTIRNGLAFTAGAMPALLFALGFHWWTLGDPWMSPYEAAWNEWGLSRPQFGTQYLRQNVPVYTYLAPQILDEFPYLRFPPSGQSMFVMSPFFFGLFLMRPSIPLVRQFLPSVLIMVGFYLVYFGSGYAQYGARYMQDIYPLLIPLALSAFTRPGTAWSVALVATMLYALLLNGWGAYVMVHYQ